MSAFTFLLTIKCVEPYLQNRGGTEPLRVSSENDVGPKKEAQEGR
ncbi:MAG: hypothetical protein VYD19_10390 [Myxococcota bacterium]|nr:hypothetical protein [Myxococcota bacterium]